MPRLPELRPDEMTPEQKRVHDTIVAGPRGQVRGPLAVWLRRPELAARAQALGEYCRYGSSLPKRLSELAILVTARHWKAEFEWYAHRQHALIDLIGVLGYYALISMTINAFDVMPPAGTPFAFDGGDGA